MKAKVPFLTKRLAKNNNNIAKLQEQQQPQEQQTQNFIVRGCVFCASNKGPRYMGPSASTKIGQTNKNALRQILRGPKLS